MIFFIQYVAVWCFLFSQWGLHRLETPLMSCGALMEPECMFLLYHYVLMFVLFLCYCFQTLYNFPIKSATYIANSFTA